MKQSEIIKFAQSIGYLGVKKIGQWREFDAYEPIFTEDGVAYVGQPLMILVKGNEIRMSTVEEAFQQIEEMNN